MTTDVLIIGAGPTGLAVAAQLIRYGVDFVVIDKKETTTPHSKAIGVQARTLEIYDQIGLADKLVGLGWIANKVRLVEGGKVRGEIDLTGIGGGMSPFPFLLIVEQGKHEAMLHDFIRSNNKEVHWQSELFKFTQSTDGIVAEVKNVNGDLETIEAKYLVGCDGAHSLVRHTLGIDFSGSTFERLFYVADVEIDWAFDHDALHANLGRNTLTAFFPMTGDRQWRIVGTFPEGHTADEGEVLYEEIERQIIADTELKFDITKVNWFSVYKVHSRHVSKFSEGRCFLAGDSAHIHTPAGAQGMNTGIQDGYNLAWKLAYALRSSSDSKRLETYNEERLPNAHRLLQTTDRFFQLAASDDPIAGFFRIHIFPYVANFALNLDAIKKFVFPLVSQIGINYRASSLSQGGDGFKTRPGDRMPYFEIDGASIYDRLREPKYHVLVFDEGSGVVPNITIDRSYDMLIMPLYPRVAEVFGVSTTFTVVLRPDNYIGFLEKGYSAENIADYIGSRASTRGEVKPAVGS